MSNKYIIKNGYAELIISSKKYGLFTTFVDIEDVDLLKPYTWFIQNYNSKTIAAKINKKRIYIHRFIMNCPSDKVIDHVNHNRVDNRKCNLKICTQKENMNNLLPNCKRGKYIFQIGNKFRVRVPKNGKNLHLGYFDTLEQAQETVKNYLNYLWNLRAV
jgi:hypothetical protein